MLARIVVLRITRENLARISVVQIQTWLSRRIGSARVFARQQGAAESPQAGAGTSKEAEGQA